MVASEIPLLSSLLQLPLRGAPLCVPQRTSRSIFSEASCNQATCPPELEHSEEKGLSGLEVKAQEGSVIPPLSLQILQGVSKFSTCHPLRKE